jgi:hypothetical protein
LQLGLHQKPIGLLNSNGFYNDLLEFIENMVRKGFLSMDNFKLLLVDDTIEDLLQKMKTFKSPQIPKWLSSDRA